MFIRLNLKTLKLNLKSKRYGVHPLTDTKLEWKMHYGNILI